MAVPIHVGDGHAHGAPDAAVGDGSLEDARRGGGWRGMEEDRHGTGIARQALAGHGDVRLAVAIEITHGQGHGPVAGAVVNRCGEGARRSLEQDTQALRVRAGGRAEVGGEQVELAIAVDVRGADGGRLHARGVVHGRGEGAGAGLEEHRDCIGGGGRGDVG